MDTDGDGIPDAQDPDTVAEVVALVPVSSFSSGGQGLQTAMLNVLEAVEQSILDSNIDEAIRQLNNLHRRAEGCTDDQGTAERNDWIDDCTDQIQIRDHIVNDLITNLSI